MDFSPFSAVTLLLPRRGQACFHCQDGGSHAVIANTRPAMLSSPRWGQPRFHRQDEPSHAFIVKMGAATISYAKDRGNHAFIAGTGPAIFSLPRQGQSRFHRQDEASHAFIARTGSDAFYTATFMRFYRNRSQRRLENRQKCLKNFP